MDITSTLKFRILVLPILCIGCTLWGQSVPETLSETEFSIGKSIQIRSVILEENRDLNIYLPSSYERDSLKTYPVIYLLDGSRNEDFIHIAGLVQFGSFPWIEMVPETIVVGIANVDRKRDFTYPSQDQRDRKELPTSGHSGKFIAFLEAELQPFIDASFRTTPEKTLIGQSLGGLLATEILLKKPHLFNNYIIVSPSLWWDQERLLSYIPQQVPSPSSIYVAVGKEGNLMERMARELFVKLGELKKPDTKLFFGFLEDKIHGDALHMAVYRAFENIYKQ